MAWCRWLLVDRLIQPAAFSDWAKKTIQANDRSVVIVPGILGFVVAFVGALYTDNVAYASLGAMVFGPLFGWGIVYCLSSAWHWILEGFGIKGSVDHSLAVASYGVAPIAWLVVVMGAYSLTKGWGLYQRLPDGVFWGIAGIGVTWVFWLLIAGMSRVHEVPTWLAAATLLATGLFLALLVTVPFFAVALAVMYWPPQF